MQKLWMRDAAAKDSSIFSREMTLLLGFVDMMCDHEVPFEYLPLPFWFLLCRSLVRKTLSDHSRTVYPALLRAFCFTIEFFPLWSRH